MTFWAYMLHCNGGYFYVGHTDDLDLRIAQHRSGHFSGFTRDHLPVTPVWSCDFPTRYEAVATEKQLKGWSRAKKMALIRGDWNLVSELAKGKGRASTSSAYSEGGGGSSLNSVYPEPVEGLPLLRHQGVGLSENVSVAATLRITLRTFDLTFSVETESPTLVIPPEAKAERKDGLWNTTCFEFFYTSPDNGYVEYNFSPSTEWAAYSFSSYRTGMTPCDVATPPVIGVFCEAKRFVLKASILAPALPTRVGLSSIIEETDGTKSYWALAHPPGEPDFHHPDCFELQLEAPTKL
jgi:predicted GIY-YIG superfamily endonuclease